MPEGYVSLSVFPLLVYTLQATFSNGLLLYFIYLSLPNYAPGPFDIKEEKIYIKPRLNL